jgi:hypothetical protein
MHVYILMHLYVYICVHTQTHTHTYIFETLRVCCYLQNKSFMCFLDNEEPNSPRVIVFSILKYSADG